MVKTPSPEEIKNARKAAKLTQTQAANLLYVDLRTWQYWEAGKNSMQPAFWELFLIKVESGK